MGSATHEQTVLGYIKKLLRARKAQGFLAGPVEGQREPSLCTYPGADLARLNLGLGLEPQRSESFGSWDLGFSS